MELRLLVAADVERRRGREERAFRIVDRAIDRPDQSRVHVDEQRLRLNRTDRHAAQRRRERAGREALAEREQQRPRFDTQPPPAAPTITA